MNRETHTEILDRVTAYYDGMLPRDRDTFEITREEIRATTRGIVASVLSDHELQRKWREEGE